MKKKHIKTRDWALVRIIQGATKAGVHLDEKKEMDRKACREWELECLEWAEDEDNNDCME